MCSQGPKEQQNVGTAGLAAAEDCGAGRIRRSDGCGSFSSCGGRNERGLLRWALSRTLLRWPLSRTPQRAEEPRQRVNHFNVGATHSPKVLRQLAGWHKGSKNGTLLGSARPGALQGVDVASYQHPGGERINWTRAAKAGIQFAAVKATEGTYYKNPFTLKDLAQAKAAGLSVIAYVFAIPNGNGGSGSPTAQADYLITYLAKAGGRMPPIMLDIEYNPYGAECY